MGRHIILTSPRSGSNFLTSTINLHPHLLNFGEVLGEWTLPRKVISRKLLPGASEEEYLDFLYRSRWVFYGGQAFSAVRRSLRRKAFRLKGRSRIRSLGVKDFAYLVRDCGLADYVQRSGDIKVVQLLRHNTLKRLVSAERMRQTKMVSTERAAQQVRLVVDTQSVLARLQRLKEQDSASQEIVSMLPRERLLELSYEDYFSSPQRTAEINAELFRFLGVEPISATSRQQKIGSDRLDEIVSNYPDLCRTLSGTPFESMLD